MVPRNYTIDGLTELQPVCPSVFVFCRSRCIVPIGSKTAPVYFIECIRSCICKNSLERVVLQGSLDGHYLRVQEGLDLHIHRMQSDDLPEIANGKTIRSLACKAKSLVAMVVPDVLELALLGGPRNRNPVIAQMSHEGIQRLWRHRHPFRMRKRQR